MKPLSKKLVLDQLYSLTNLAQQTKRKKKSYTSKNYRLQEMRKLLSALGNPHLNLKCFHIAGTKGKGSTAYYLQRLMTVSGYRVGLYVSPQILDERDRFSINGNKISWRKLLPILNLALETSKKQKTSNTVFDIFTASAFVYFQEEKVDYAVIETGLGGRLDSTNVIHPLASIITPIDFDHVEQLGNTLTKIAKEKAGIIKQNTKVFSSLQQEEAMKVIQETAKKKTSLLHTLETSSLKVPDYQRQNFALAKLAFETFFQTITKAKLRQVKQLQIPGRLEKIGNFILDGAHNPLSMNRLVKYIDSLYKKHQINLIFYCLDGKDVDGILNQVPQQWQVNLYPIRLPFSQSKEHRKKLKQHHRVSNVIKSFQQLNADPNAIYVVSGSFYLVASFLRRRKKILEQVSF